jgi:benzodiazapine receptor
MAISENAMKNIIIVIVVALVSIVGGIISGKNLPWYYSDQIVRSPHSPPGMWFGIIWTVIYVLYAWTWCMASKSDTTFVNVIFGISILLNLLWTGTFFGLHNIGASRIIIVVLLGLVLYQAYYMWNLNNGIGTFFMLIYASWLICATALNFETFNSKSSHSLHEN